MKKLGLKTLLVAGLTVLAAGSACAETPGWWEARNVLTVDPVNDYAAVNQGQLKWIAKQGWLEMSNTLAYANISNMPAVYALVQTFSSSINDFGPANVGHLKYIAKPFYDVLIEIGYQSGYPWTAQIVDDVDYAHANIGQTKNLFSFDLSFPGDVDGDGLPDFWEFLHFSNLLQDATTDADNDGLTDYYEWLLSTNPNVADSDGDQLTDWFEVLYGFNPNSPDALDADPDNDGLNNQQELAAGTHPLLADTDGDGIPDGYELQYAGLDPLNPNDALLDSDGDGLVNRSEFLHGTDPGLADSDGDGLSDGDEVLAGGDPASAPADTLIGTIWVDSGTDPDGAVLIELTFNPAALEVLNIGRNGMMAPCEYGLGETSQYDSGTARFVYWQAQATNAPSGSNDLFRVQFKQTGSAGASSGISVSVLDAADAGNGTDIPSCSAGIRGIPEIL